MYLVEHQVKNCDQKELYGVTAPAACLVLLEQVWPGSRYFVALYLKSIGWNIALSPASRGPADIVATCSNSKWFIQVKASGGSRAFEVTK